MNQQLPKRPAVSLTDEERATYAVFDMAAGTLALRAVDLTPRLQAMLRRMTERPPDTSSG